MIRDAKPSDAAAFVDIYGYYVQNTAYSYEETPPDTEEMERRIREYTAHYPWLTMEEEGRVIGYAYANRFRERAAYLYSVEISVYFHQECQGHGYGRSIVSELLSRLKAAGCYTAVATLSSENIASEKLFLSLGFEPAGVLPNIGYKFGRWHTLKLLTKPLGEYDRLGAHHVE